MRRRWMRHLFMATVAMMAIVAFIAIWNVFHPFDDPFDKRPFSESDWSSASHEERARMSRDLIRNHLPVGLSEDDVLVLLGPPSGTITHDSIGSASIRPGCTKTLEYYLGCWSNYGMDSAFVYVHLDHNGRVAQAEIIGG